MELYKPRGFIIVYLVLYSCPRMEIIIFTSFKTEISLFLLPVLYFGRVDTRKSFHLTVLSMSFFIIILKSGTMVFHLVFLGLVNVV